MLDAVTENDLVNCLEISHTWLPPGSTKLSTHHYSLFSAALQQPILHAVAYVYTKFVGAFLLIYGKKIDKCGKIVYAKLLQVLAHMVYMKADIKFLFT